MRSPEPAAGVFPWFALQVKFRHEKTVSQALRGKGYTEYLPLYRGRHHSGGRFQDVDLPLFPTYVFCRFDPLRRLPILTTPGVFSIVGTRSEPLMVDEEELGTVRRLITFGSHAEPWPFLQVGDPVYVEEGPLRGTHGILQRFKNEYRLVISISLLQRSVAIEIDRSCVRPAGFHPVAVAIPEIRLAAT
jgi:transcription antitermination factor NusG